MKNSIFVFIYALIYFNYPTTHAEEKGENFLDFKKNCNEFDGQKDSGLIPPKCFRKYINNSSGISLMGFPKAYPSIGTTYALYITEEEFKRKKFKKVKTGNVTRKVDKFLFVASPPVSIDNDNDNGRHFYCDMSSDGFLNAVNRVQCTVVSNSYCTKLYDLKKSLNKCQVENLAKFTALDRSREINKSWFSNQPDGAQNVVSLIKEQLDHDPRLDFRKGLFGHKTQIELKHMKNDFETNKSMDYYKLQEGLNKAFVKDFDAELVLCEEVFQKYAEWLTNPKPALEATGEAVPVQPVQNTRIKKS